MKEVEAFQGKSGHAKSGKMVHLQLSEPTLLAQRLEKLKAGALKPEREELVLCTPNNSSSRF